MGGIGRRNRLRVGAVFALAEGGMPLAGFFLGSLLSGASGKVAPFVGIVVLLATGIWMMYEATGGEEDLHLNLADVGSLVLTSLSVSMDELAIGVSMGALGLPIFPAVVLIAAQAFLLTYAGTALGNRVGERLAGRAGLVAGVVLTGLAVALLLDRTLR